MVQTSVDDDSAGGPFTFAAVWHVRRESIVQFEALLRQIIAAAAVFPGHEGVHAVTPAASSLLYTASSLGLHRNSSFNIGSNPMSVKS